MIFCEKFDKIVKRRNVDTEKIENYDVTKFKYQELRYTIYNNTKIVRVDPPFARIVQ